MRFHALIPLPRGCSTTELRQRRVACECVERPDCRDACHKAEEQASTLAPLVTLGPVAKPMPGRSALSRTRAALQLSADRFVLMNDRPKKSAEKMRQEQRLRDALRENLKRRKAQVKGRAAA